MLARSPIKNMCVALYVINSEQTWSLNTIFQPGMKNAFGIGWNIEIVAESVTTVCFGRPVLTFVVSIVSVAGSIFVARRYVKGSWALSIGLVRITRFALEFDSLFGLFQLMEATVAISPTAAAAQIRTVLLCAASPRRIETFSPGYAIVIGRWMVAVTSWHRFGRTDTVEAWILLDVRHKMHCLISSWYSYSIQLCKPNLEPFISI